MTCKLHIAACTAIMMMSGLTGAQPVTVTQALDALKTHEFGQHMDVLDLLRDAAARAQRDPEIRQTLNVGFTEVLQSDTSYAAKQFACRLLVLTATHEQIPMLGTTLQDPQMSHMALSVLVHLKDRAVDPVLIKALQETTGHAQLGIITAIGNRQSLGAFKPLEALLDSNHPSVVEEAALALGRIGTKESATALNRLADQYQSALPGKVADAILVCADNQTLKDPGTAEILYRRMLDKGQSSTTRCAALNGLAHLLGPESLSLLITALNDEDVQMRGMAAQLVRTLPGTETAVTLTRALNTLAPATQVLVIKALEARGDTTALKAIEAATAHSSVNVRIAALNALASVGDETVIRLLADQAMDGDPQAQAAARRCLASLTGAEVNAEIVTQLAQVTPAQQVVLIEALAKRQAVETAQTLLSLTQSDTRSVHMAALTALGTLGSEDEIAELAGQLVHDPSLRHLTGQTLVQIAGRTGRTEEASSPLLQGLSSAKAGPLKTTLLQTLGHLKHDSALPVLTAAMKDEDRVIRYNAIKALSAWPHTSPAASLLTVAQTAPDNTHRILALRGHISLVSLSSLLATEKLGQYQRAMALASAAEKKRILARLPDLGTTGALGFAAQHLADPATVTEAAQAAITLAQHVVPQDPDAAASAMRQVIESAVADPFKQTAQQVLHKISTIKGSRVPATYQALERRAVAQGRPWAILARDGASRSVKAYLSSLAQGETATGVIASPTFVVPNRTITFTLCGHDGQGGGRGEDFMALVDAHTGRILQKTPPPGHDGMKTFTWDTRQMKGTRARIEVHDGNPGTAYAWMGVGSIDASPAFKIDFSQGMPTGWVHPEPKVLRRIDLATEGVPFRQNADLSNLIPPQGSAEFACGFMANRLFFLGATVDPYRPAACCAGIEIHYQVGSPEVFPLICAYTLNAQHPRPNQPRASHLHSVGSADQFYLAITPRQAVIKKIRLVAQPNQAPIPHITAITCETTAAHDRLVPLTGQVISSRETDWISAHSISAESIDLGAVMQTIHARHEVPKPGQETAVKFVKHRVDNAFRSEGVAVADFNGDGQLDIATGNVYYAGPNWTVLPMLDQPVAFNRLGYSSAFLCFAEDVDKNGDMDLIVVGFPGQQTHWLENPGQEGMAWKKHLALSETGNESPMVVDLNGDGHRALLCFNQGRCVTAQPGPDPRAPWLITPLSGPGDPAPGHGLGVGDLNRDGRVDVIIPEGWWQSPSGTTSSPWSFHKAALFGGVQMCVHDLDGDGDADVLGSSAHGYGIAWSEQTNHSWQIHEIDQADSQTHAIHLADINADGLMDFVTGKRFWAHNGHDPGSFQPAVLCWYEQSRKHGEPVWIKHVIDFDSGVGLHFQIIDLNRDGQLDIVTSNKKGVHIFRQVSANTGT